MLVCEITDRGGQSYPYGVLISKTLKILVDLLHGIDYQPNILNAYAAEAIPEKTENGQWT